MGLIFNEAYHNNSHSTFLFPSKKINKNLKKKKLVKKYNSKKHFSKTVIHQQQLIPLTRENCDNLKKLGYKIK